MITVALTPTAIVASSSSVLNVSIRNVAERTCANLVVDLRVPPGLGLQRGPTKVEITRLAAGGERSVQLLVRPPAPGLFAVDVVNVSYRDGAGRGRRHSGLVLTVAVSVAVVVPRCEALTTDTPGTPRPRRPTVFLSYRRDDSEKLVVPLAESLGQRLPRCRVFLDRRSLRPGTRWADELERELGTCAALVAIMGGAWEGTPSRLFDDDDQVRHEIATVLRRRVPVVPLLLDGRSMPRPETLPEDVRPLTAHQATALHLDAFAYSVDLLANVLRVALLAATGSTGAG